MTNFFPPEVGLPRLPFRKPRNDSFFLQKRDCHGLPQGTIAMTKIKELPNKQKIDLNLFSFNNINDVRSNQSLGCSSQPGL
jgi:hypothetical protein